MSKVPTALSNLLSLSVLNLSGNSGIEMLPPELGLLSKCHSFLFVAFSNFYMRAIATKFHFR